MNAVISDIVIFENPISGRIECMPVEMIATYIPYASHLRLEEAAKIAAIRDEDSAANLFESLANRYSVSISEGCGYDELSVEAPSLR